MAIKKNATPTPVVAPRSHTKAAIVRHTRKRTLDQIDRDIVACFRQDPGMTYEVIAKQLTAKPSTVEKRVRRLIRREVLKRTVELNWQKLGYEFRYRIDILINSEKIRRNKGRSRDTKATTRANDARQFDSQEHLAQYIKDRLIPALEKNHGGAFTANLIVEDVVILLGGSADLSVTLWAKDLHLARLFVTEGLRKLPGVNQTSTAHVTLSCTFGVLSFQSGDIM